MTDDDYSNNPVKAQRAYSAARWELVRIATQLQDIVDHINDRPQETCFGNLPEDGDNATARFWPGCKSFDAAIFPTPSDIQAALEAERKTLDVWRTAFETMPDGDFPRRELPRSGPAKRGKR